MNQPKQNLGYKSEKSTIISLEKGKIPPQAIDLEEVILGAALIEKSAIAEIVEILSDLIDVFYKDAHKHIFQSMLEMFADNIPIDLLTISQKLKEQQKLDLIGGDFYLIGLTQRVSSSAHIEIHCRILMQMYVKRQSIKVASDIIQNAYDETSDIFDVLDTSQRTLDNTAQWLLRKKPKDLKAAYASFLDSDQNPKQGVPSKLSKINKKTNGYHEGDLVIVAARPGMGKTALILNEAKHQAKQDIPVGILSLEMITNQLVGRFVSDEYSIESSRIKYNQLTPSEKEVIRRERKTIEDLPIYIHDEGSLSTMEAKTIIGKWVRQFGVRIVYIDYLQLMDAYGKNKSGNREQEISYISRTLKAIAKEFGITIVALSQLSRAVETRGGFKRPILSDLRESGAIEQDADVVMFLYRPEYYKIDEWDDDDRSPTHNQCEINIAKIREGETGATIVGCDLKYMRFHDLVEQWEPMPSKPMPNIEPSDAFDPLNSDNDNDFEEEDDLPF